MNYKEEALNTLKEIVSYNTVNDTPVPNGPFGKANKECLERFLQIGEELGFSSKNVDGYAGHIEFKGNRSGLIGILGHLDIVPVGEGWKHDPFKCEIEDGYMYGRGVVDDKGAVIACLYAMKQLKDEGFIPSKSIRLIAGCNEENGSNCVKYYFTKEQMPDAGFTPDAEFPLIHCEKGIKNIIISFNNEFKYFKNLEGGEKTNMVPAKATCVYTGNLDESFFQNKGLSVQKTADGLQITAFGKNAHGSTPELGENAIWKLFDVINEVENSELSNYIYNTYCKDCKGIGSKIGCKDDKSGELSQNLGILKTENNIVAIVLDIRHPVSTDLEKMLSILKDNSIKGIEFTGNGIDPLFIDTDSSLVKTLMGVYKEHTGSQTPSLIIGGGTYAKEMKNCVAFGPEMEGEDCRIHNLDERLNLNNFYKFYDIYKDAIEKLSK